MIAQSTIISLPFSREQLIGIAAQINAASNEILTSLATNGGSADTMRFLDYLWKASRGVLPQAWLPGEAELAD